MIASIRHGRTHPAVVLFIALLAGGAALASDEPARFDSPEAAVKALQEATKSTEKGALAKVFGSGLSELCSGDEVRDRADIELFARKLSESNKLIKNDDGSMTLSVGRNEYPFPVPLVQKDGKWFFDTAAGKEEVLSRRVGENELKTIAVVRAYVVAQREYAQQDRAGNGVMEFAQRLASTPGKKDGLYWESREGEPLSPLGPFVAEARSEGYSRKDAPAGERKPQPYHGYLFKILTKQGAKAPGGKIDYVINDHMLAGFALVAWPVEYGKSGVMTFIVNANGRVFQKDLGEKTGELAPAMSEYDPGDGWTEVKD